MRKALTLVVLAASTSLSVPAWAQEATEQDSHTARYERLERQNQQRYEQRQQRRERAADFDAVPQADRQAHRVEQRERVVGPATRDAWQGHPDDPNRARYERLARENALRHGTPEQRREVREEIRQARRDRRSGHRHDPRYGYGYGSGYGYDPRYRYGSGYGYDPRYGYGSGYGYDPRYGYGSGYGYDPRYNYGYGSGYGSRYSGWDLNWRRDPRYDWQGYRSYNRGIFRGSPYYSPYRNHRYRRYGIGSVLDSVFRGRNYWIGDPWQYRLPPAPRGYVWVRYYNDVVLVDRFDGRIVDVIHDFFW